MPRPAKTPPPPQDRYRLLSPGDPAPLFTQDSTSRPDYAFHTVGGRYVVLCFFSSAGKDVGRRALSILDTHRRLFDDDKLAFFGVSLDPDDQGRLSQDLPGVRYFWDFDARISALYGAAPEGPRGAVFRSQPRWVVLDPMLRVRAIFPFRPDGAELPEVIACLEALPPVSLHAGVEAPAPILYLPDVFEAGLCDALMRAYEADGGQPSGFMREQDGRTVLVTDPAHKRRHDVTLSDPDIIASVQARVLRRIVPEVRKVHQFDATRMERYLVACYKSEDLGHFAPHRDNTTRGTAHRRFAVSVNLNSDFDGGEISFPEYGPRSFKPPKGGAVVFSCSLLHTVAPVTRGRRFAFLPFLYDDAAARIREANNAFLSEDVGDYSMQA